MKGEQPLYRCPQGGFHKFRKSWITIALGIFFPKPAEGRVRARKCTKCGKVYTKLR